MWQLQLGMALGSAVLGAQQAKRQAAMRQAEIQWNNHLGELANDAESRNIAQKNAEQYSLNLEIYEAATEKHALNQMYSDLTYENRVGVGSSQETALLDTLTASLEQRNIKGSQTANAILGQAEDMRNTNSEIRAIGHSNEQIDIDAQRDNELSTRNFGSLPYKNFIPASSAHIDPGAEFMNTLLPALGQAGMQAVVGHKAQGMQNQQMELLQQQTQWYNELLNPWKGIK